MFCQKCGEPIRDGEACQACIAKQKDGATAGTGTVREKMKETAVGVGGKIVIIGKEIGGKALKEVEKTLEKKAKKVTHKALVKLKLKKESPLDKAEKIWKQIKK